MLTWVSVGKGRLAVRGRPGRKFWEAVPELGVTSLLTLLSQREGASAIGAQARAAGLEWTWLPLENADLPEGETQNRLQQALPPLAEALLEGESLVIHCAAGIHRTGMIAYALLRLCGLDTADARQRLAELRPETANGVGETRLAWGDQLIDQLNLSGSE